MLATLSCDVNVRLVIIDIIIIIIIIIIILSYLNRYQVKFWVIARRKGEEPKEKPLREHT